MGQRAVAACKWASGVQESKWNAEDWLCRLWIMRPFAERNFNCALPRCPRLLLAPVSTATCATLNEVYSRLGQIIRQKTRQKVRRRGRGANCECHLLIARSAELFAYELWMLAHEVKPKMQLHHNITISHIRPITPRCNPMLAAF